MARSIRFAPLLVVAGALLVACRPDAAPIAPRAPASGGGFVAGETAPDAAADPRSTKPWRDALRGDRQAIRIPDHTPMRGAAAPLVTVVHFGDYTDPKSAAQARAIDEALRRWPDDVRLAFVHVPGSSRPVARMAAQTAAAAGATDRFWDVHDRLFADPPADAAAIERVVTTAGLDLATWRQAIADRVHEPWIAANIAAARELGVARAGVVAINGRTGPKDAAALVAAIGQEREATAALVRDGLPRAEIYAEILAVADVPKPLGAAGAPGAVDPQLNYAVPAAGRPVLGPVDARVTIIAFSDFQCPFCARAQATLAEIRKRHPDDVRIVFRNLPLAFHAQARDLAKLALAADRFGKFWPMHDLIFESGGRDFTQWKRFAKKSRLDPRKLARAMAAPELEQMLAEDAAVAAAFGARGTPTFFVNGRLLGGAQPVDAFEALITEELAKAEAFAAEDPGGEGTFYDRLIEGFAGPIEPAG